MLTKSELDAMDACVADIYNIEVTLSSKSTSDAWLPVMTNVPAWILQSNMVERATGYQFYNRPVDASLRLAYDARILVGMRVTITQVQGLGTGACIGENYEILNRDVLLTMGRQMDCKLWRMG